MLEQQTANLANGGLVSTELVYEALNSDDAGGFNLHLRELLREYLNGATPNNNAVLRFNAHVVEEMKADPDLGRLAKDYHSLKGGPVLHPYLFLEDDQRFGEVVENWKTTLPGSESDISVETEGPGWSRVELKIPGGELYRDPSLAKKVLERIRTSVQASEVSREYVEEKANLRRTIQKLESTLTPLAIGNRAK